MCNHSLSNDPCFTVEAEMKKRRQSFIALMILSVSVTHGVLPTEHATKFSEECGMEPHRQDLRAEKLLVLRRDLWFAFWDE
jgi:hypothetical protein